MKVQKNNVVELTYELIVDGKLADKATQERPLGYIHGTHMLLPKFESEVEGKEPGDEFAFTLTPEEGYGTFDETRLFELPKAAFEIDGKVREDLLVVGQIIPMLSNTGRRPGNRARGKAGHGRDGLQPSDGRQDPQLHRQGGERRGGHGERA